MFRNRLMASVAPLIMLGFGGLAHAQTAQPPASPPPASPPAATSDQPATSTLGEIVITAEHVTENLQRAAMPVDAVSGANLSKAGITNATTLGELVPGLAAPDFGGGTVSYFIRGVGNFSEEPFGDPAIAYNYDNVYLGLQVETGIPFYDLQRVEVLKGPQGTLYGRNATGGAINVLPNQPQTGVFGGYVNAGYGNYSAYDVEGAVNIPIGDETALRFSGDVVGHGPYLSDGTSDEDTKSFRAQILSHITPQLTVRISGDYTDVGGVGAGGTYLGDYTYAGPAGYIFHPTGFAASNGSQSPSSEAFLQTLNAAPAGRNLPADTTRPFIDNKLYGTEAEIDYDTGFGTLTVIPAWRGADADFGYGTIGTPAQVTEKINQYSIEARFLGRRIGIFDYSAGALYYAQDQAGTFVIDQGPIDVFQNYVDNLDSYAFFGRATANLTDQFRVVGGVRYTVDHTAFNGAAEALTIVCLPNAISGCPGGPEFQFSTTPGGQPLPVPSIPIGGGAYVPTHPTPTTIISRTDTIVPQSSLTDTAPTFRVALEYDVAPHSLLYASVETGYRSGGFNIAGGGNDEIYQPEHITAYTIGSKNRFFDSRIELNGELFLWKYTNQQVSHLTEDAAGNANNIVQNIGASTNQGVEVEGRFLVTSLTLLTANVQYLDATDNAFTYRAQIPSGLPPVTGCPYTLVSAGLYSVNCSGMPAFNSPKWTINLGIEQTIPLDQYKLVVSANTQYLSSRYVAFDYLPQELAPAVWQSNAQVALSPDEGKWTLAVYVRNIENTRYPVNIARFPTGDFLVETTTPPLTFGVQASARF